MNDFEGLTAAVTGGSSGIGAATARELNDRGAQVVIMDLQPPTEPAVGAYVKVDISDDTSVQRAAAMIADQFGQLDILVNNAGIGAAGTVAANPDAEWARVLDINVTGLARVTRAVLGLLRESPYPAIINTASGAALRGLPDRALYSASKGAVVALTYAMAADHIQDRIRVNAVAPGTVDTPWIARLLADSTDVKAASENLRRRQPLGRLVTAEEIAFAIANLASPRSAATTGAVVAVDGGFANLRL